MAWVRRPAKGDFAADIAAGKGAVKAIAGECVPDKFCDQHSPPTHQAPVLAPALPDFRAVKFNIGATNLFLKAAEVWITQIIFESST
jgi:hypothetical protein